MHIIFQWWGLKFGYWKLNSWSHTINEQREFTPSTCHFLFESSPPHATWLTFQNSLPRPNKTSICSIPETLIPLLLPFIPYSPPSDGGMCLRVSWLMLRELSWYQPWNLEVVGSMMTSCPTRLFIFFMWLNDQQSTTKRAIGFSVFNFIMWYINFAFLLKEQLATKAMPCYDFLIDSFL